MCGKDWLLRDGAFVIHEEVGEDFFERRDFGKVADLDVGIAGVVERVVLVIVFAAVEVLQRSDLGDDLFGEDFGGVELGDVGGGDPFLFFVGVEDGRAVGSADVGALAVELSRVVGNSEEDAQEGAGGDFGGVVDNLDGFGVAGGFGDDLFVGGGVGGAAGIAGGGVDDAAECF